MFVLANLLLGIARVLDAILSVYFWILIARVVVSWVNADPYNPIVRFLYNATEPLLYRIRRRLPALGGFDLSPLVVMLGIQFIQFVLVRSLQDLAGQLRY